MLKWILLALLSLLALLFFSRVRVELLSLDSAVTVKLRLLHLFRLQVYPIKQRPKKVKKAATKKTKAPKPLKEKPPKAKSNIPLGDYIQTLCDLLPLLGRCFDYWLRHTTIDRLWVRALLHDEDAADTAVRCGRASAAANTLYVWFRGRIKIKQYSVNILPNFTDTAEPVNLCLWVSASPAGLLWGLVLFLCRGGVALWRGPLVAQLFKKPTKTTKRQSRPKEGYKQIKDGVS